MVEGWKGSVAGLSIVSVILDSICEFPISG